MLNKLFYNPKMQKLQVPVSQAVFRQPFQLRRPVCAYFAALAFSLNMTPE